MGHTGRQQPSSIDVIALLLAAKIETVALERPVL